MTARLNLSHGAMFSVLIGGLLIVSGCGSGSEYPNRPITLVCPWAAGGGTDRVSRQMAVFLEHELGTPVNVINATGGQGVTGHARGLLARPDGYTIAMMTLELNMLHWRGLTDLDWQDCVPLMSVNEDPAALFVRTDSNYETVGDLETAIAANPETLKASGTASLGAWHLALAGWLLSFEQQPTAVVWIPSQGAKPSLQELMSGSIDIVCCSVPEARSLLDSGEIRCLGVMADKRLELPGLTEHPTLKEQGSDWTLTGWRGLGVPTDTPPEIQQRLVTALRRIVTGESVINDQTFPQYMEGEGFDYTWRQTDDFGSFLERSDKAFGDLLGRDEFQSVQSGPIGPSAFPTVAFAGLAGSLIVLGVGAFRRKNNAPSPNFDPDAGESRGDDAGAIPISRPAFLVVPIAVIFYVLAADVLGFILSGAVILAGLSLLLGAKPWAAVSLAVAAPPIVYLLFTALLRVPLPPGVFGW